MSEPTAPPPGEAPGSADHKALKQEAAAAKARSRAARPWYKKKRFAIPLALLLLIILVSVGADDGENGEQATEPDDPTATQAEEEPEGEDAAEEDDVPDEVSEQAEFAGIGEEARDGDFAFTVTSIENVGPVLEGDMRDAEASGEFYVLDVTVENIGGEAQTLSARNQYLYDADERQFSAVSALDLVMVLDTPVFEQLNPGASIEGQIVFDVPEGVEIEFAGLHDSALSGGVLVDLR